MNKWSLISILSICFIIASLISISIFVPLEEAKWSDDGVDMVFGLVIIFLIGFLYKAFLISKNKNILLLIAGFSIKTITRIFEIFLQEYQISINYTPTPYGLWALNYFFVFIGIVFIVVGLKKVIKK